MSHPLLRRASMAVCLAGIAGVLFAGCGANQDTKTATAPASSTTTAAPAPSSSAGQGSGQGSGQAPGTTAATAAASGDCPATTTITVHVDGNDKTLTAKAAKAVVTLGATLKIGIGNFDVPDEQIDTIAAPKLTGDQLYVSAYLSANQGKKLEAGTYTSVADKLDPLQLNTSEADTADGKVYFTGFADVKEKVTITMIDKAKKKVCGTITTQTFDGDFAADIVSWS